MLRTSFYLLRIVTFFCLILFYSCNLQLFEAKKIVFRYVNLKKGSCDSELKDKVEAFAVGEGNDNILEELSKCPRDVLTKNLTEIQENALEDDPIRVKIAYLFCRLGYDCERNKSIVLLALSPKLHFKNFYADDVIVMIAVLIRLGDKSLLSKVFNATEWADGSLAEGVSSILAEEILKDPDTLLESLRREQFKLRQKVYLSTGYGLLDNVDKKSVFNYLKSVKQKSPNYSIAKEMLSALKHNSELKQC